MSHVARTIVIDQLVLDGLELGAGRADRLCAQIEAELSRLLSGHEIVEGDIPLVEASELSHRALRSEDVLAAGLARRIAAACTTPSAQVTDVWGEPWSTNANQA